MGAVVPVAGAVLEPQDGVGVGLQAADEEGVDVTAVNAAVEHVAGDLHPIRALVAELEGVLARGDLNREVGVEVADPDLMLLAEVGLLVLPLAGRAGVELPVEDDVTVDEDLEARVDGDLADVECKCAAVRACDMET